MSGQKKLPGRQIYRAGFKDYSRPGKYMITLTAKEGFRGPFCHITGDIDRQQVILTDLGQAIQNHIRDLAFYNPFIQLRRLVIMPDHVHFLLQVTRDLVRDLGSEIAVVKCRCSQSYSKLNNFEKTATLFKDGFNDRIVFTPKQLEILGS